MLSDLFLATVSEKLAFLSSRYGYSRRERSAEWLAEVHYARGDSAIVVSYGDRESVGTVTVERRFSRSRPVSRYALWEWLDALRIVAPDAEQWWLLSESQVVGFISGVSKTLEDHLPAVLAAPPAIVFQLESARSQRLHDEQERQLKSDHQSASLKASRAFWARLFPRVVELLEPFEDRLSPADAGKLAYSRKQRSGGAV